MNRLASGHHPPKHELLSISFTFLLDPFHTPNTHSVCAVGIVVVVHTQIQAMHRHFTRIRLLTTYVHRTYLAVHARFCVYGAASRRNWVKSNKLFSNFLHLWKRTTMEWGGWAMQAANWICTTAIKILFTKQKQRKKNNQSRQIANSSHS